MSGTLAADGLVLEGADRTIVIVVLVIAVLALLVAVSLARWVVSNDPGTERMQEIQAAFPSLAVPFSKSMISSCRPLSTEEIERLVFEELWI